MSIDEGRRPWPRFVPDGLPALVGLSLIGVEIVLRIVGRPVEPHFLYAGIMLLGVPIARLIDVARRNGNGKS